MQEKKNKPKNVLTDTSTYHTPSPGSGLFESMQSLGSKGLGKCAILGVTQKGLWRANSPGIEEMACEMGRRHVPVQ